MADDSLAIRLVAKQTPGGGLEVFRRDATGKMTPFTRISPEDALTTQFVGFDVTGTTLYALDSRSRDKAALVTIDVDTRRAKVIAQSDKADVSDTLLHPPPAKSRLPRSSICTKNGGRSIRQSRAISISLTPTLAANGRSPAARATTSCGQCKSIALRSPSTSGFTIAGAKQFTRLFTARPNLEGAPLSPMHPVEIKARDGLDAGVLSVACRAARPRRRRQATKPLPMVLDVHGGPWARDSWGYNP